MNRQTFPIVLTTYEFRNNGTEVYFPQIIHHHDEQIERTINRKIERAAFRLIAAQKEQQDVQMFDQMIGSYEIKTNERNVLSVTLSNYAIHENFAHGLTIDTSLTFDLETGKEWSLSDLFMQDSDYEARLERILNQQIEERDLPVFDFPVSIRPNQDYYIADKVLVIYYQLYEISPYYVGLPKFPIVVYQVEDLLARDSLFLRMLP